MGKAERRKKDQAHAEYMKKHNIQRNSGNCPICHKSVSTGGKGLDLHFRSNNCR